MIWACGTLGKWLSLEDRTLVNGVSALMKESREVPSTFWQMRLPKGVWIWKRALTPPWWHPDLRLPACKTVRNKFLLFIRFHCVICCYSSPEGLRQLLSSCDMSGRQSTKRLSDLFKATPYLMSLTQMGALVQHSILKWMFSHNIPFPHLPPSQ